MERKGVKYTPEVKVECAKLVASGKTSAWVLAQQRGFNVYKVRYWAALYKMHGASAFWDDGTNNAYLPEMKLEAVVEYLSGKESLEIVSAKYGLRSPEQLRNWIKMYNSGKDFSHKMSGGSRMKASRTTTKEERIQIVRECIANGFNYGECAIKYNVSYQQVYGWVKRFKELGDAGLEDRRGRRKADQEPRSEVEKLQIEIEKLKHQLYMTEMERDLLKKLNELEREELFRK